MSITNSGKVGIGNCAPASTLCVIGNIRAICCHGQSYCSDARGSVSGYTRGSTGVGVYGSSCSFVGVLGESNSTCVAGGTGVAGYSANGVGVCGASCGAGGIGVKGVACNPGAIPIVACGSTAQTADLQQWRKRGSIASVVNKCGWLGVGTSKPQSTLQVNGGVSLGIKTETLTKCYTMKTNCFAILANPSVAGKNVTLPAAKNGGMVVFIKNISTNSVNVKASGSDNIEAKAKLSSTYPLSSQYASVTLIASGGSPGTWYVLSTGN